MTMPILSMIDKIVTPNDKPKDLKEGDLWATHSGVLKIGECELKCHILSNGERVFDAEDVEKFFGGNQSLTR